MKKVRLELTLAEANALWKMASQVAEHGDILEQEFRNGRQRAAAESGYEKLLSAVRSASTRKA